MGSSGTPFHSCSRHDLGVDVNVWYFASIAASVKADDDVDIDGTVEDDLGKSRDGSRTDDEAVQRSVGIWVWNCTWLFNLNIVLWITVAK